MSIRRLLSRLVIEDWVRTRDYPTDSVWLSLLNHLDGVSLSSSGLIQHPDEIGVELRKEPEDPSVLEVQVIGEMVRQIQLLQGVKTERDEVL